MSESNQSPHLPIVAMYMAIGAELQLQKMTSSAYRDFIDGTNGHLGVMNDYVLEVAKHVAQRLDERGDIQDWPGVFDYEVSEPLGEEIIRFAQDGCTIETMKRVADTIIEEFFAQ